ncbi:S8 family serine peptidase [Tropicibacter sp. Alg240-R139]|uniref:S8 family serine peptidase n=1 Tax=Tropicibacter sp. Alg240-R139 TaxID=2305991 RepID=UPI0013E0707E|nr:S8 family serine peptidase [Tropicibacter sp. Alg240-R139]
MLKKITCTSTRYLGILVLAYAMALPAQFALSEGGEGGNAEILSPAKTSKPQSAAPPKKKQTRPTTQRKATTAPTPVRRSQPRPRRVVETAPSGQPPAEETRFIADEVIVRFQLSSTSGARNRAIRGLGMTHLQGRTFVLPGVTVHRYRLSPGVDVRTVIERLEASAAVVNAQPNYLYVLQQSDSSTKLPQFGNDKVGLSEAHARTKGRNTRIAVIDTAVDGTHSELSNTRISSFDVTDEGGNIDPHGTSIAGILAADAKLTGVAPAAEIVSIAAFSKDAAGKTVGNTWTILEATNVAHKQNVDILNMSFAGPADPLLKDAMEGAKKRNILPVAAAGNDGPEAAALFPAGYETVVSVTATDTENQIYSQANTGDHVDIAAPGVGLLVLGRGSGFRTSSGTSLATAYISGIAALTLSANPQADYATLRALLENSATDLGKPGKDSVFGAGIPSAVAAVGGLTN